MRGASHPNPLIPSQNPIPSHPIPTQPIDPTPSHPCQDRDPSPVPASLSPSPPSFPAPGCSHPPPRAHLESGSLSSKSPQNPGQAEGPGTPEPGHPQRVPTQFLILGTPWGSPRPSLGLCPVPAGTGMSQCHCPAWHLPWAQQGTRDTGSCCSHAAGKRFLPANPGTIRAESCDWDKREFSGAAGVNNSGIGVQAEHWVMGPEHLSSSGCIQEHPKPIPAQLQG